MYSIRKINEKQFFSRNVAPSCCTTVLYGEATWADEIYLIHKAASDDTVSSTSIFPPDIQQLLASGSRSNWIQFIIRLEKFALLMIRLARSHPNARMETVSSKRQKTSGATMSSKRNGCQGIWKLISQQDLSVHRTSATLLETSWRLKLPTAAGRLR